MVISRRNFLQISTLAGGGFLLGFALDGIGLAEELKNSDFRPNAWLRIESSGRIIFILDKTEMGQGVYTALPSILAEELEVQPESLVIEMAPADRAYINPQVAGLQITGGSTSVAVSYQNLRQAGAAARSVLVEAAAQRWKIAAKDCIARDGSVYHPNSGQAFSYGELAHEASKLKVPENLPLKDPKDFKVIGKARRRLDSRLKVTGEAGFGIDVKIPELRNVVYIRSPIIGAKIKRWDGSKAKAQAGVEDVLLLGNGIVIVALRYWQARRAADALEIEWDAGASTLSSEGIFAEFELTGRKNIQAVQEKTDFKALQAAGQKTLEADYHIPYAAHAAMEPINCTVRIVDDSCEIWAPTQSPGVAQQVAHELTGLPFESIKVHTTFIGGGFGRRLFQDFVAQAVNIALLVKKPIKLLWSREEDFQHDFFRPATFHAVRAALDSTGRCSSWLHTITGPSILSETLPTWIPAALPTWLPNFIKHGAGVAIGALVRISDRDPTSTEGALDMPYEIPTIDVSFERIEPGVPIGFWRSVGHSYTGFVVETMVDELAHLAEKDPLSFRHEILQKAPRHQAVLSELAKKSAWGQPLEAGLYRGLALHASFGTICGQVAEVRVDQATKTIKVERVVCVLDCGLVINPSIVEAQIAGAVVFGISAALLAEITIKGGAVEQSNFHDYPVLRYDQCPRIEVSFIESKENPTGVGEPGVPPIAAALANAVFAATGKRQRRLPLKL